MTTRKQAILVSYEGEDGLGKSTQVRCVKDALESAGNKVVSAKLPAYETFTGRLIARMLKSGKALSLPNLFQLIQWLDKVVFQLLVLPKLLRENDYVLLDRWHASMWAYGLSSGANEWLTNLFINSLREPHLVLVFSGTNKRVAKEDAYEADNSLQKSVRLHYVLWACTRTDNVRVIKADGSRENVTKDALAAIYSIC